MEAVHSSKTSANFYLTTPCHISEASIFMFTPLTIWSQCSSCSPP
jgi:hypothetical protein